MAACTLASLNTVTVHLTLSSNSDSTPTSLEVLVHCYSATYLSYHSDNTPASLGSPSSWLQCDLPTLNYQTVTVHQPVWTVLVHCGCTLASLNTVTVQLTMSSNSDSTPTSLGSPGSWLQCSLPESSHSDCTPACLDSPSPSWLCVSLFEHGDSAVNLPCLQTVTASTPPSLGSPSSWLQRNLPTLPDSDSTPTSLDSPSPLWLYIILFEHGDNVVNVPFFSDSTPSLGSPSSWLQCSLPTLPDSDSTPACLNTVTAQLTYPVFKQ